MGTAAKLAAAVPMVSIAGHRTRSLQIENGALF
jgi:hypothetical protein